MSDETTTEKDLRLLLRAEFADFKLALFKELQGQLDGKVDVSTFETLRKEVSEVRAQLLAIMQTRELEVARESGIWFTVGKGRAALGWIVAVAIAVAGIVAQFFH